MTDGIEENCLINLDPLTLELLREKKINIYIL